MSLNMSQGLRDMAHIIMAMAKYWNTSVKNTHKHFGYYLPSPD